MEQLPAMIYSCRSCITFPSTTLRWCQTFWSMLRDLWVTFIPSTQTGCLVMKLTLSYSSICITAIAHPWWLVWECWCTTGLNCCMTWLRKLGGLKRGKHPGENKLGYYQGNPCHRRCWGCQYWGCGYTQGPQCSLRMVAGSHPGVYDISAQLQGLE